MADTLSIKADPDKKDPDILMDDEDEYEDTGELQIPNPLPRGWLTRVPRSMHQNWTSIREEEPVKIGVIRRFKKSGKHQVILDSTSSYNKALPKEYNLQISETPSQNTFVFSEKDLPGYKSKHRQTHHTQSQNDTRNTNAVDKSRRYQPYFRRTIPKQTALSAAIEKEATCFAVENEEYRSILDSRMKSSQAPKQLVEVLEGDPGQFSTMVLPGNASKRQTEADFGNFVRTGAPPGPKKTQENKAARMPEQELLDKLFECFNEYRYWPANALRAKLKQPEAYLRSTLDKIAELIRSGPFTGTFKLRPEYEQQNVNVADVREEKAPEKEDATSGPDDDDDDDDDEGLEMEDAL